MLLLAIVTRTSQYSVVSNHSDDAYHQSQRNAAAVIYAAAVAYAAADARMSQSITVSQCAGQVMHVEHQV
jgi:hypothetical protein